MSVITLSSVLLFCVIYCHVAARYTDKKADALTRELVDALIDELDEKDVKDILHRKRVIGGEDVDDIWPWLVSLRLVTWEEVEKGFWPITWTETEKVSEDHFCGASLLDKRWLLTAAHCIIPNTTVNTFPFTITGEHIDMSRLEARLGDKDLSPSLWEKFKNSVGGLFGWKSWLDYEIPFEKIIIHPEYRGTLEHLWANDIALIKLSKDVPATPKEVSRIQSVELPEQTNALNWPADNSNCVLKGWGCTQIGGVSSDVAQKGILPKIPDSVCSYFLEGVIPVTERLCAGPLPSMSEVDNLEPYKSKGDSGCPGDSGGPLMCPKDDGSWVQAGVASFVTNNEPGKANYFPTVFTRVTRYVNWIHDTISKE